MKGRKKTIEPEEFYKRLGARIKQLRKEKGYRSYEDLALEAGIPRTQYGRYERGINMKMKNLVQIMNTLGMTANEFFAEGFD